MTDDLPGVGNYASSQIFCCGYLVEDGARDALPGGVGVAGGGDDGAVDAGQVVVGKVVVTILLLIVVAVRTGVERLGADDGEANADLAGVQVLVQAEDLRVW